MPSTSTDPAQNPTQAPAQSLTKYLEIPAHLCAQSDNGKTLWVLEPKGLLRRYDLSEGQVMRRHARIPKPRAWDVMAAHPEGRFLLLCDEDSTQLMEHALNGGDMLDLPYAGMQAAAVSPDGRTVALAHPQDGVVVINADTLGFMWQAEYSAPLQGAKPRVTFSGDGAKLAVNHGSGVGLHDARTGQILDRVAVERRDLFDFATNPTFDLWALAVYSGEDLFLADADPSVPGGWLYSRAMITAPVTALALGPGRAAWVGSSKGELVQVEPILREVFWGQTQTQPALARALEATADGSHLVSLWSDGTAKLFDLRRLGV